MQVEKRKSIFQKRIRDYQRNMQVIKKRTALKGDQGEDPLKRASMKSAFNKSDDEDQIHDRYLEDAEPLKAVIRKIHVQEKVKQFVSKLKRNTFSNKVKVPIHEDDEDFQKFVERVEELDEKVEVKHIEGIVLNNLLNMWISLLTFLAVVYMQVISSFQCFLYQFRAMEMGTEWLITSQYVCLILSGIKILRNFTAVKTVHGYRLLRLEKIVLDYLYSIEFATDTLFFFSIMLMISRPYTIQPAFATYVISLIVILLSPRIDQIIITYVHVGSTTRQYLALMRLLSANLFFNHIMGTLYMAIADTDSKINWMIAYGIEHNYWLSKYNYSFYFAVSVTTTAVLGDVRPANNRQAVLTSLMMLYGCLVLSYNISQMTGIFTNIQQTRQQLEKDLQVLQRLAQVAKIDNKLHREMANYLVHSNEIKFQYEIEERNNLIAKLPQNMRAEFLEQNSQTFFKKMPFFSLLRSTSKKILAQKFTLEINSPGQYITHKRQGMQKVNILKMGTVGLAYKKKNAKLNGLILDRIEVQNDEIDNPVLLNAFLFNKGKRLNYSIVCQSFCTVGHLEFDEMMNGLRQCEIDYEFWRQFHDSDQALDEEWTVKRCEECEQLHTMFNCPKLTYMPLRSIIYIKYSFGKTKSGLMLEESQKKFNQIKKEHLKRIRQKKNKQAMTSPLKYWDKIFLPLQKILQIDAEKTYQHFQRVIFTKKQGNIKKGILDLDQDEIQFYNCDIPYDYDYYYKGHNPKHLVKIDLGKNHPGEVQLIPRFSSI